MECNNNKDLKNYSYFYESKYNSWNYSYQNSEELEELAPGKTIFFISRNQDSSNIFHGTSELLNALSFQILKILLFLIIILTITQNL